MTPKSAVRLMAFGAVLIGGLLFLISMAARGCPPSGCSTPPVKVEAAVSAVAKPQTTCPVMGGKIDRKQYVDVKGHRAYVCCPGCIAKIKANGETPEKAPTAL